MRQPKTPVDSASREKVRNRAHRHSTEPQVHSCRCKAEDTHQLGCQFWAREQPSYRGARARAVVWSREAVAGWPVACGGHVGVASLYVQVREGSWWSDRECGYVSVRERSWWHVVISLQAQRKTDCNAQKTIGQARRIHEMIW